MTQKRWVLPPPYIARIVSGALTTDLEATASLTPPSPVTTLFCLISFLHLDYVDTTNRRTQWTRPAWLVHSRSGRTVQPVDTPLRRIRQDSITNIPQPSVPPTIIPSTPAVATGGGDNPLPSNWETRITPDGKTCEKLLLICRPVSLYPVRRCQYAPLGENV